MFNLLTSTLFLLSSSWKKDDHCIKCPMDVWKLEVFSISSREFDEIIRKWAKFDFNQILSSAKQNKRVYTKC